MCELSIDSLDHAMRQMGKHPGDPSRDGAALDALDQAIIGELAAIVDYVLGEADILALVECKELGIDRDTIREYMPDALRYRAEQLDEDRAAKMARGAREALAERGGN